MPRVILKKKEFRTKVEGPYRRVLSIKAGLLDLSFSPLRGEGTLLESGERKKSLTRHLERTGREGERERQTKIRIGSKEMGGGRGGGPCGKGRGGGAGRSCIEI